MRVDGEIRQDGSAGILAVIILALLGVIGAGMVGRSSTEVDMSANYRNGVAAKYLAESGARWAEVRLKDDKSFVAETKDQPGKSWSSPTMNIGVTSGNYTVTIAGSGNNRTITSVGTVGKSKRMVYFQAAIAASSFGSAVFCGSDFIADQNTTITGSVGTNGNAIFGPNSRVSGIASANGTVTAGENSSVPETESVPLIDIPTLNIPWSNYSALPYPTWPLSGGSYYVDGSLTLNNNTTYTGNGTIYVNGFIVTEQNVTTNGNITLVALRDIDIGKNMDIAGELVLEAKGNISIGQEFRKTSSAVGSILIVAEGAVDVKQDFGKHLDDSKASLFANGKITIEPGANIKGFVISGSGVALHQNTTIIYDCSYSGRTELPAEGSTVSVGPWNSFKPN